MDVLVIGLRRRVILLRMKFRMRFVDGFFLNFWFAGVFLVFFANFCGFFISVMGINRCIQVIKRVFVVFRFFLRRFFRFGWSVMIFIKLITFLRLVGSLVVLFLLFILERTLDSGLKCVRMFSIKFLFSTFGLLDVRIGKFFFKVCVISERVMFGRCSYL